MTYSNNNPKSEDYSATADKYPQKYFKDKNCRSCGKTFTPIAPSHLYCSDKCSDIGYSDSYLKRVYGISWNRYQELLSNQNNVCAICKEEGFLMDPKRHKLKLVVDHCHSTGVVRGLLCHNCNRALGLLKDSKENLSSAIQYLEGATTIPSGSTPQANGGGSAQPLTGNAEGDDIV